MFFIYFYLTSAFNYTKPEVYRFVLKAGKYKVQCFGAQGGPSLRSGGKGAYVSGNLTITGQGTTFYAYVGGEGGWVGTAPNPGGFNGGGQVEENNRFSGGGATDLRVGDISHINRIIVAAGGSATYDVLYDETDDSGASKYYGAPGGELNGYYSTGKDNFITTEEVSQIKGQINGIATDGGGGGFMGGKIIDTDNKISISGSSYISGYPGCTERSLKFTGGEMKSGIKTGNGSIIIDQFYECPNGCSSCTGEKQCTECFEDYLYNGECIPECPKGTVRGDNECLQCDSSCTKCIGTVDYCTECKEDKVYHENKCIDECTEGFIEIDKKCEKCQFPCTTCQSKVDKCLSCADNYILYQNECYLECPDNTVRIGSSCEKCIQGCTSCYISTDNCTSCEDGFFLVDNKCVVHKECPEGTVGYNGQCIECRNPCKTCSSVDVCTSCIDNFFLKDGVCYVVCPSSTIKIGDSCVSCETGCKKCTGSYDYCEECNDDYYSNENKCYAQCTELNDKENGKYFGKDENSKSCVECTVKNCADCSNDYNTCTECSESFTLENDECVPIQEDSSSEEQTSESSSTSEQTSESSSTSEQTSESSSSSEQTSESSSSSEQTSESSSEEEQTSESSSELIPTSDPFDPTTISCLASLESQNITLYDRCYFSGFDKGKASIFLKRSLFVDFFNESNGGAIFIQECVIEFTDANFTNCVSSNGCGGAIYIKNSNSQQNDIIMTNLAFKNCKASYGGAVYIYSSHILSNISINVCVFIQNEATGIGMNEKSDFYGGSALFLGARNCFISECKFYNNKGSKGAFKIYNVFNDDSSSVLENNDRSIVVSNCDFEMNNHLESSIYYINGKEGSKIEIKNCNFKGKLRKQLDYIDGKELNSIVSKLSIKQCNFEYNSDIISYCILASILTICAMLIALIIAIIYHSKKSKTINELEKSEQYEKVYE